MNEIFINKKDDPVTYINMSVVNTRKAANRVILLIIDHVIELCPDWRFNQLLLNIGATKPEDLFYEESKATLERVLQDEVVNRYFKKHKKEKAEVLDFNEYKNNKE